MPSSICNVYPYGGVVRPIVQWSRVGVDRYASGSMVDGPWSRVLVIGLTSSSLVARWGEFSRIGVSCRGRSLCVGVDGPWLRVLVIGLTSSALVACLGRWLRSGVDRYALGSIVDGPWSHVLVHWSYIIIASCASGSMVAHQGRVLGSIVIRRGQWSIVHGCVS